MSNLLDPKSDSSPHRSLKRSWQRSRQQAFTLMELLVVIVIVIVIAGMTFPMLKAVTRGGRIEAGINTLAVGAEIARKYATGREIKFLNDLDPNLPGDNIGRYSGSAIIFTPANEMRLVENHEYAISTGNNFVELLTGNPNAYRDIPGRDYITVPRGTGYAGISRFGPHPTDDIEFLAPPFALHFDEHGHLLPGRSSDTFVRKRLVYYDANNDNEYRISSGNGYDRSQPYGGGTYNPDDWDPEISNVSFTAPTESQPPRYQLPFEELKSVVAVLVFNKDDFSAIRESNGWDWYDEESQEWLRENGRAVFFNRYTGVVIRDN